MAGRWFAFAGALAGGLYLFVLLAVAVHEILGHGLAAILCGGRFVQFSVKPGFTGYAWYDGVPASRAWIVTAAGNAINVAVGLPALALSLRWRHVSLRAFVAWLVAATNLGLALGYTLQGLAFGKGDAHVLARDVGPTARIVATAITAALLLGFAVLVLRRLARMLEEQFEPRDRAARRRAFLLAVVLPVAAMLALKPQGELFDLGEQLLSGAVGLAALLALGLWVTRRAPPGAAPEVATRLRPLHAVGALLGAAAGYAATALWLAGPVPARIG
jgi:hypothetical protein